MKYSDSHNTEILATMGPTLCEVEHIIRAIELGVRNLRIHMGVRSRDRYQYFLNAREAEIAAGEKIEILIDLPTAKPRVGKFKTMKPEVGNKYLFVSKDETNEENTFPLKCIPGYAKDLKPGHRLIFGDGKVVFRILDVENDVLETECIFSCSDIFSQISSCVFPDSDIEFELFDQDDLEILTKMQAAGLVPDWIALSFANNVKRINEVKRVIKTIWKQDIKYMAKIEDRKGLDNFAAVLDNVDGVMVARGDMLSFIEPYKMPYIQQQLVIKTREMHKTTVVATEMLEQYARTGGICRPELSDIALAVRQGASAVMLSVESSNSSHSADCMLLMRKIIDFEEEKMNG